MIQSLQNQKQLQNQMKCIFISLIPLLFSRKVLQYNSHWHCIKILVRSFMSLLNTISWFNFWCNSVGNCTLNWVRVTFTSLCVLVYVHGVEYVNLCEESFDFCRFRIWLKCCLLPKKVITELLLYFNYWDIVLEWCLTETSCPTLCSFPLQLMNIPSRLCDYTYVKHSDV